MRRHSPRLPFSSKGSLHAENSENREWSSSVHHQRPDRNNRGNQPASPTARRRDIWAAADSGFEGCDARQPGCCRISPPLRSRWHQARELPSPRPKVDRSSKGATQARRVVTKGFLLWATESLFRGPVPVRSSSETVRRNGRGWVRVTVSRRVRCSPQLATLALVVSVSVQAATRKLESIPVPGAKASPESITSTSEGFLFVGRVGDGGIVRVKPRTAESTVFVQPGTSSRLPRLFESTPFQ